MNTSIEDDNVGYCEDDAGHCKICETNKSPRVYANKSGLARNLPGLAFFIGYFCDSCLSAAQFGFNFSVVAQKSREESEQKEGTQ